MYKCELLAQSWNRRRGWTAAALPSLDERFVAVLVDPAHDDADRWRQDLEVLEIDRFVEWGFVGDAAEHRSIYDPVLASTTALAIGWAPTGEVLSVCRFMVTSPGLAVPLMTAIDRGDMRLDDTDALDDARVIPGVAVEATIVSVPKPDRPGDAPSPTDVCHGLFMATAWALGCRWILSAVDPGALARGHRNARAGHLIRRVGAGTDTTGLVTEAISLRVGEVLDALAADPDSTTTTSLEACRPLVIEHLATRGARLPRGARAAGRAQPNAPRSLLDTNSSPGRPLTTR